MLNIDRPPNPALWWSLVSTAPGSSCLFNLEGLEGNGGREEKLQQELPLVDTPGISDALCRWRFPKESNIPGQSLQVAPAHWVSQGQVTHFPKGSAR